MSKDADGHLSLANARTTESQHLATANEQLAEWDLTIRQAESKISDYQAAIEAQKTVIADAKAERGKLRKKRLVFQRAAFALELIDQE